jgi:ketosteroid isomerase-like protein
MKKLITLILSVVLFSTHSYSQTVEEAAIKKVCIAETKAYNDKDYEALASYHVQSVNDQIVINTADGSFSTYAGWDSIGTMLKRYFENSKKEPVKLGSSNFTFEIHSDMAFVSYDASSQNKEGKTTLSREYRILLNVKGKWKILAEQVYLDYVKGK